MAVERKTLREAALAAVGVLVFLAFLIAGSLMDAGNGDSTGAFLMVAGIVVFILVMGAIGLLFLGGD